MELHAFTLAACSCVLAACSYALLVDTLGPSLVPRLLCWGGGKRTVFSLGLFGVVRTTWLVPGNPFAPLCLNSNYDIHSATRLISN